MGVLTSCHENICELITYTRQVSKTFQTNYILPTILCKLVVRQILKNMKSDSNKETLIIPHFHTIVYWRKDVL